MLEASEHRASIVLACSFVHFGFSGGWGALEDPKFWVGLGGKTDLSRQSVSEGLSSSTATFSPSSRLPRLIPAESIKYVLSAEILQDSLPYFLTVPTYYQ